MPEGDTVWLAAQRMQTALAGSTLRRGEFRIPQLATVDLSGATVREVVPATPGVLRIYACGPTVYRYAHVGNLRTFLLTDLVRRAVELRGLRGTAFDVFGRTAERKMERQLIRDYENVVEEILATLAPGTYATAVELAAIPEHIRGYGHVKDRHLEVAKEREAKLTMARSEQARLVAEQSIEGRGLTHITESTFID